ncbi:MAG: GNAT family N-acetyltransferase [Gammaproteobacteria bacterium]
MTTRLQPGLPSALVRPATRSDVTQIAALDHTTFGDARAYPTDFFFQQLEIAPPVLFVADVEGVIAGYAVGTVSPGSSEAWILSVAVDSVWRGRGLGTALTRDLFTSLVSSGAETILLSVEETNAEAIALYRKLGFRLSRTEPNYFGPNENRAIMVAKQKMRVASISTKGIETRTLDPNLLLGESQSSIDFTNVLFAVSLAVLAIVADSVEQSPVIGVFLFLIVTATFYSSIYYAVVAGNVARLERHSEVERAILYGNVLSEYFGVLLVVPLVPLLVWVVTESKPLTWMAFTIATIGYVLYTMSGFDLVSRTVSSSQLRRTLAVAYSAFIFLLLLGTITNTLWLAWASTIIIISNELFLACIHLRRTERPGPHP